jgi:hypothetical protein
MTTSVGAVSVTWHEVEGVIVVAWLCAGAVAGAVLVAERQVIQVAWSLLEVCIEHRNRLIAESLVVRDGGSWNGEWLPLLRFQDRRHARLLPIYGLSSHEGEVLETQDILRAQECSEGEEMGSFGREVVGTALGGWIAAEFARCRAGEHRRWLVDAVESVVTALQERRGRSEVRK